jgi:sarcosine oxidase subunit alpha
MTTTTAAAGLVMQHLEYVRQVLRPAFDVQVGSVTEHWAQFAVAGPLARQLLEGITAADISPEAWPFMACGSVDVLGVQGRLFRISFSGELAYEIAVPARYGDSLFRLLVAQAEALGGGAYGMEALNVLRIEKGFITHAEIDGRVTACDLGMEGMVSKKKDCIGFAASRRPGLMADDRGQLVGLKAVSNDHGLLGGAHLFAQDADPVRANAQGHVTSVCYAPTLDAEIGLGFLSNGRNRMGEIVRHVDHLRGVDVLCEVVNPVFYDPEGGRVRG